MGGDDKDGYYCTICGGIPPDQIKIKKIPIDGKETGIDRLDWILEDVAALKLTDEEQITDEMVRELARCANLAPSCNNFQPERFVFVYGKEMLEKMKPVFNRGNEWCHAASLIIAAFTEKKLDCVIKDREYYLFDTGMAVALLLLRATEMGLVAHPIAGYKPDMVKEVLGIPAENTVITVILVGKKSETISPVLSPDQVEREKKRPERFPLEKFAFKDLYGGKL
jgi:nitroreductase